MEIHQESLQQLLNKVRPLTKLDIIPGLSLSPGDVAEIQGGSSSGKSHFIHAALMTCITPVDVGGWDKAAVLFDSDNSFDLNRFKSFLSLRLSHPSLVDRCLGSLHIFRPTSSIQLASSLLHLPSYHKSHMPRQEIALLAIDSLSAFYWPDRFTVEQLRSHTAHPLRHILIALQRFRVLYRPLIIFTNWGLTFAQSNASSDVQFYKQHLTLPDSILPLTHHVTLASIPAIQSPDQRVDTEDEVTLGSATTGQRPMIIGAVRLPGVPQVVKFTFTIEPESFCQATYGMNPY
ncbi:hypothetical protein L218DRAFT_1071775 [Marasmius fiardii PR-910]|nr:hypothetical protein L218DRAFT_1071775 [Marasmius fiardii PR-910]